jgi:hypothetical protein
MRSPLFSRMAVAGLFAAVSLFVFAAPASASRSFEAAIGGFSSVPSSVALDGSDNLWVTDRGDGEGFTRQGIYQYDPFPSQTLLGAPRTIPIIEGTREFNTAVDEQTGELFVAQGNGRAVYIFSPPSASNPCKADEPVCFTHAWTRINSVVGGSGLHIAIDNSNTASRGRVYLSLRSPENDVEAFDASQRPVEFPAVASYISGNTITGTPSGPFGQVQQVEVDDEGNIYVTDVANKVVDQFDSSGLFVRALPAPGAFSDEPGAGGAGVDPTNGNILVTGRAFENSEEIGLLVEYDRYGNEIDKITSDGGAGFSALASPVVNSDGYVYFSRSGNKVDIFGPAPARPTVTYSRVGSPTTTSAVLNASVDPNGAGAVTECEFEYGAGVDSGTGKPLYGTKEPCTPDPSTSPPASYFTSATNVSLPISSLTTGVTYHYRTVVHTADGVSYGADQTYTPQSVLDLHTEAASNLTEASATLHGTFVGNGEGTHYYFEWGRTTSYGNTTATPPGADAGSPSGEESLQAQIEGLDPYSTYHFRVVASNGGPTSYGEDRVFTTTPGIPTVEKVAASSVHADRALVRAAVNPNGAPTDAHVEYVTDAEFQVSGWANAQRTAPTEVGMGRTFRQTSAQLTGLEAGKLYHYRVVGENQAGAGSAEGTFKTFPFIPSIEDHCPNAHVRQQTGTILMFDCRAYELVSAADAGGYDVESSLVPGQVPFSGYPEATDGAGQPRVLYGVHYGAIPGAPNPTNHGVDPYTATRTDAGWRTDYVGIPAAGPPSEKPFASSLVGADARLGTFAFGGPEICSPCFPDGKTGMPLRLPGGELIQGMAGALDPGAAAAADGFVGKRLSADGSHFVFASSSKFENDGNGNGDISVYDRNLVTGGTQVVSKTPSGATMTGPGIGELDISADGSHILIGQLVSQEGEARYWHLYMNVDDSDQTLDLMPGSASGALFDGMTADGSKVFFTSADQLVPSDEDASADIYEADLSGAGAVLHLVSTGTEGTGNADDCEPAGNTVNQYWNTAGTQGTCDVVAIGGGGGVASGDGTIYFLSPELLDGPSNGTPDAPNLYMVGPGQAPVFVATLESTANAPLPPPTHGFLRSFGGFERPGGVAIDHSNGDFYVYDLDAAGFGSSYVYKFNSSGRAILDYGENGKITVNGSFGFASLPTQIAVDNDPSSPSYRDLYVPEPGNSVVKKFDPSGANVDDIEGAFFVSGVATDPADGDVYLSSLAGFVSIYNEDLTPVTSWPTSASQPPLGPTGLAVDSTGKVYVTNGGGFEGAKGTTEIYDSAGAHLGQLTKGPAKGIAVDPWTDHVYVNEGNQVREFDPSGNPIEPPITAPSTSPALEGSFGVAVNEGTIQVADPGTDKVLTFGPRAIQPDPETDSPLAINGVSHPGTRFTGDFQINSSGDDAVFVSSMPLTGYNNASHREVFRYHALGSSLDCVSCNPTGEEATGDQSLPPNGLALSEDGRVFFNAEEGLVDRDLNGEEDAYEWQPNGFDFGSGSPVCSTAPGCVELISTGFSAFPARLLSISSDATDAYFFTRDKLNGEDLNGNTVKIYDARELGGFKFVPAPIQCKASDECHGPGTMAPPSPDIKTVAPSPGGNEAVKRCKRKFVKRRGKCVRKKPRHRKHKQRGLNRQGKGRHHG